MNTTTTPLDSFGMPLDRASIRSANWQSIEKPTAQPHWSFDESLRTKRQKRVIDLNSALRALQALASK